MRVTPSALASERDYEIPACVTIAQAILESATSAGWGSSPLFRVANNPFGIKYCHFPPTRQPNEKPPNPVIGRPGDQGNKNPLPTAQSNPVAGGKSSRSRISPKQSAPGLADACNQAITRSPGHPMAEDYGAYEATTWEIENGRKVVIAAEFQRFPSLEEAFRAHALLLCSPRYWPAFAVRHDWKQFAERLGPKSSPLDLEHCGYSTNPSYSAQLVKLVNLYRLDDPRAQQWYATGHDPGPDSASPTPHGPAVKAEGGGQKAVS